MRWLQRWEKIRLIRGLRTSRVCWCDEKAALWGGLFRLVLKKSLPAVRSQQAIAKAAGLALEWGKGPGLKPVFAGLDVSGLKPTANPEERDGLGFAAGGQPVAEGA